MEKTAEQILAEKGIKDTLFINEVWSNKGLSILMEEYAQSKTKELEEKLKNLEEILSIKEDVITKHIDNCVAQFERICSLESGFEERKWISVEERLPTKRGDYFCWDINCDFIDKNCILHFDTYNNQWTCQGDTFHPSHWMPLPTQPKI